MSFSIIFWKFQWHRQSSSNFVLNSMQRDSCYCTKHRERLKQYFFKKFSIGQNVSQFVIVSETRIKFWNFYTKCYAKLIIFQEFRYICFLLCKALAEWTFQHILVESPPTNFMKIWIRVICWNINVMKYREQLQRDSNPQPFSS